MGHVVHFVLVIELVQIEGNVGHLVDTIQIVVSPLESDVGVGLEYLVDPILYDAQEYEHVAICDLIGARQLFGHVLLALIHVEQVLDPGDEGLDELESVVVLELVVTALLLALAEFVFEFLEVPLPLDVHTAALSLVLGLLRPHLLDLLLVLLDVVALVVHVLEGLEVLLLVLHEYAHQPVEVLDVRGRLDLREVLFVLLDRVQVDLGTDPVFVRFGYLALFVVFLVLVLVIDIQLFILILLFS